MSPDEGVPPAAEGPEADQQQPADLGNVGSVQSSPYNLGVVGSVQSSPYAEPPTSVYDPLKFQDWVRSITNYTFLGIFALTIIASFYIVIWQGQAWTNAKDLLQLLLPAETALLGSAVGFYFGSQMNKAGKP